MHAKSVVVLVAGALVLAGTVATPAHHSFDGEFDRNKPVTVTGSVTKVEWTNPHARVYIETKDETGKVVTWDFELAGPNGLMRRGWTRKSLQPGDAVTVTGYAARLVPFLGNASTITMVSSGRKMFAGSSAEGPSAGN